MFKASKHAAGSHSFEYFYRGKKGSSKRCQQNSKCDEHLVQGTLGSAHPRTPSSEDLSLRRRFAPSTPRRSCRWPRRCSRRIGGSFLAIKSLGPARCPFSPFGVSFPWQLISWCLGFRNHPLGPPAIGALLPFLFWGRGPLLK